MEQGYIDLESIAHKDTSVKAWMEIGRWSLFKSMSVLIIAQQISLAAVDMECLQEYEEILKKSLDKTRRLFTTDKRESFTLRACFVNMFTEPHVDDGDVKNS